MSDLDYLAILRLAAPEAILTATVLAVLLIEFGALHGESVPQRNVPAMAVGLIGIAAAAFWLGFASDAGRLAGGLLVLDPPGRLIKLALLFLGGATLVLSLGQRFTEHVGEYVALLLLAIIGMLLLVSTEDTLMLYVALELTSLSLYILAALDRRDPQSTEAALKYFLFGGTAAAFLLFGLSLLYGLTGTTQLVPMAKELSGHLADPLHWVAVIFIVAGFGFKLAAVPFHLWAPDTYAGAPTLVTGLIASGSKVASVAVFAKVLLLGLAGSEGGADWARWRTGWTPLIATLAVASLLLGNLAALAQSRVKRLLAWSAIAHAGYLLTGLVALADPPRRADAYAATLFYVITYAVATLGALGVIAAIERSHGDDRMERFAGLGRRDPVLAVALLIFLLSLAGIPPLAGFFGKFYVFATVLRVAPPAFGLLWLVLLGVGLTPVALYYYLVVLKQAFVCPPPPGTPPTPSTLGEQIPLIVLALVVVGLGIAPSLLVTPLLATFQAAGW